MNEKWPSYWPIILYKIYISLRNEIKRHSTLYALLLIIINKTKCKTFSFRAPNKAKIFAIFKKSFELITLLWWKAKWKKRHFIVICKCICIYNTPFINPHYHTKLKYTSRYIHYSFCLMTFWKKENVLIV